MDKMTIIELTEQVNKEIVRLEYSGPVVSKHRILYQELLKYAQEKGIEHYDDELGEKFLLEIFDLSQGTKSKDYNWQQAYAHAAIVKLGEYQAYGAFGKLIRHNDELTWAIEDKDWLLAFSKSMDLIDVSKKSQYDQLSRLKVLYKYLGFLGIRSVAQIQAKHISQFSVSVQKFSGTYIRDIFKEMRRYFRFCYSNEYTETDLSKLVPRICVPEKVNVPALWTESDIEKLLSSIDRSTAIGKRDYAVLLMTTELGLRSCDVNQVKLSDFNWQRKELEVTQSKTNVLNICPLTDELGWAVIDYIRSGRPKSELPYLFLTANAPYTQFGQSTARHILKRHIRRSGISEKPMGVSRGTHSLRHTFARKLLANNIPLELITEIMGHTALTSSSPYLKVDIEGLRECALSIEEVRKYVG